MNRHSKGVFMHHTPLAMAVAVALTLLAAPTAVSAQSAAPAEVAPRALNASFSDLPFAVSRLEISGSSVYPPAQLLRFALALAGSSDEPLTVPRMTKLIEQVYREDGFALAEAVATVDAAGAAVRWQVTEGHVTQIRVTGADEATRLRIERYLQAVIGEPPLKQSVLERAVALSDDLASVNVSTSLVPLPGEGHLLEATVTQNLPVTSASLDWVPMRPGHSTRLALQHERYGLVTAGDLVRLQAVGTRDRSDGHSWLARLHYRTPRGNGGDYLELIAGNGRSDRDPGGLAQSSELRGTNLTVAWGYPVQRDLHGFSYVIGALDHARARMNIGAATPRSETTAARLYLVNGDTTSDGHLHQYTLELSAGTRPATPAGQADDGRSRFVHLRAGLGTSGNWSLGRSLMSYRVEALGQWTSGSLPSVEKFALGHHPFLRGYAPAEVVGDRGAAFTFELAHHGSHDGGTHRISPFAFVAAGRASTVGTATVAASGRTLASTGIGLRGHPLDRLSTEIWCAWPLRAGPLSKKHDPAIYVQVGTQW
jgi:hemolysin activation/secretion protein